MPSKSKVCFFFDNGDFSFHNRKKLKQFLQVIFKEEGKRLDSLNYIFCSDKRLLEINQQFLFHNYYTDIITFNLSETTSVRAEVYISIDRVRENASNFGVSFKSELHRVIFHGALHLCGYKDKGKAKKKEMREMEDYYLLKYLK